MGAQKMLDVKMTDVKLTDQFAGHFQSTRDNHMHKHTCTWEVGRVLRTVAY